MYGLVGSALIGVASATSLSSLCTSDYVTSVLPTSADDIPSGITIDTSSVTASTFTNYSVTDATFWEDVNINFCEISFAYTHQNQDDRVVVQYWMPSPDAFNGRFLATGGAAYTINNGSGGADMSGGGSSNFDDVVILGNGTANWPAIYNWGYQAIAEMTQIGKAFTSSFFNSGDSNSTDLYTYFVGCSEGGREAMSQAQRAPELSTNHLAPAVQIQTHDYYPPVCVFETVLNATINACDAMDGKIDGVVARSDLCLQNFNVSSMLGKSYYCEAGSTSSLGLGYGKRDSATPVQNGTFNEKDIEVVQDLLTGLKDSEGRLVYFPFQPAAGFGDTTVYDSDTDSWTITSPDSNGEWVTKFLNWQNVTEMDMYGVTNDDLKMWILKGMNLYGDSLQTTYPDLSDFYNKGGRLLHYHGEADTSIPTTGSIHYHESVRKIMYPDLDFETGNDKLNDWYRFYIVPGAAHCAINADQPNAGFPRDNFALMIDWVENSVSGANEGEVQQICTWPARPYWTDNTTMVCQQNASSVSAML
ncbi:tannase and feruloyl esterase [Aspergillus ellipticus CBS 707.79]|uniref:Carboxylic ester hydrolase n=1 Tax=Aspergillus ellipticus CBS 707.79 TaxID=1448320 RepID=A0A319DR03_9EURO|nr:tannase and feruloyl esterase [Aspergillus ellipticus CBS 707.79]